MPAGQERALRRRIRSIESTQKITRAMELIAASRITRAQQAIGAAKPYTERMGEVVRELGAMPEARGHWAFAGRGGNAVVVVLGADRGLCGAFNVSVLRAANELLKDLADHGVEPVVIGTGRKVVSHFRVAKRSLAARFEGMSDRPRFEDARSIVQAITDRLGGGTAAEVHVVSTRFSGMGSQQVESRRLVPLENVGGGRTTVFELEPGPAEILDRLLPRWLEAELYSALLESAAAFHVAQQRAMKAATDNADDLMRTLRRAMNRARQDSITTEIVEIVGGAEALRQSDQSDGSAGHPDIYVFPEAS
jgi:F-type H+-transporting ATPase subunit gamma